jgi:peptidoglycan/xylan/chitin deacetylase (PgdA/CDA1 family)
MVRGSLKAGLAAAAHLSAADRLYSVLTKRHHEAFVLGYHRVVADFEREASYSFPSMLISRAMLECHLDWIARRFQVVSLDELRVRLEGRSRTALPIAAITFDDGYRDVYEHAFPLLMRKGLPATVFVATNYVGTDGVLPHDKLYLLLERASHRWSSFSQQMSRVLRGLDLPLPVSTLVAAASSAQTALRTLLTSLAEIDVQRIITALEIDCGLAGGVPQGFRSMTWDMLADMRSAGMGVGSHTMSHSLLTNESAAKVIEETAGSQQVLTAKLGAPATCFAYPDGRFDATAVRAVAAAGYRTAVTTCDHREPGHPWLTVPRLLLWERSSVDARGRFSPAILGCQASGLVNRFSVCRQSHALQGPSGAHPLPYGERHSNAH